MATSRKGMNYDHPAYTVPIIYSGGSAAGANGVTTKFAAFTAQKIMAVVHTPNIVSTTASQAVLYTKSGTATATTTLTAITSAAVTTLESVLATPVTLAKGDQFWYAHGTDATVAMSVAIETRVIPGSDVTVQ